MNAFKVLLGSAIIIAGMGSALAQDKRIHFINCGDGQSPGDVAQTGFISKWEAANPGYKINREFVPWAQCQDKVVKLASAGDAPAVAYMGSRVLKKLAASGLIVPIQLTDAEKATYAAPVLRTVTADNAIWGLPVAFSTKVLYWNKDLFAKAGLDPNTPPKTWAEMLAAATAINKTGDANGFGFPAAPNPQTLQEFLNFVYANGGDVINTKGENVFNSPNNVEALEFYAELAKVSQPGPIAYTRVRLQTLFAAGKLGMMTNGPWLRGMIPDVKWGVAPIPAGPKGTKPSTVLITDSLAVFKGTGVEAQALSFAKWMTNPDNQLEYDIAAGYTPLRDLPGVAALRAKDPTWGPFLEVISSGGPEPFVTDFDGLRDVVNDAIQSVILGKASAASAIASSAKRIEEFK